MAEEEVTDVITDTMEEFYDCMMRGFATAVRSKIEPHFAEDTSEPGSWMSQLPSTGHSLAASMVLYVFLGARCHFRRMNIHGQEHIWIRCSEEYAGAEIDITADQLGEAPVLVSLSRFGLRPDSEPVIAQEIDPDIRSRFLLLFSRMTGLDYKEAKEFMRNQ